MMTETETLPLHKLKIRARQKRKEMKLSRKQGSLRNFLLLVSTNMSRGHSELPVRILTTGESTCNRLTLFGNATVHCKRGIFYEEQFIRHLVWMLHGGQSSDVTSLRPTLASGAAADRSDVYGGSVKI